MSIRRLENHADIYEGAVTYDLGDGRFIRLDLRLVQEYGLSKVLEMSGIRQEDTSRVDVFQHGRKVGTVPWDFEPSTIRSTTFLYDPRPGDFKRVYDHWEASKSLGPGDLTAIPGFIREQTP